MTKRQRLAIAAAAATGAALGLGAFTFGYARGYSYLADDPGACANCHVMTEHFDAWNKSSHHSVATCNDCHTPHDNIVNKYLVKAENGFFHSLYFTTGDYPYPLRIRPSNHEVTERACRYCHAEITEAIDPPARLVAGSSSGTPRPTSGFAHGGLPDEGRDSCIRCHTYVGHLVR
ncbi:MAG TPA: cytochrome c nitrite reductase small subunit [Gemmatimonadales bacterium]